MKLFNWMQRKSHQTATKENKEPGFVDELDEILTVGTLGFDPLKPFIQHSDYHVLEDEEINVVDYIKEHHQQESHSIDGSDYDDNETEPLMSTRFTDKYEEMGSNCEIFEISSSEFEVVREEKAERVTLAELFLADKEMKKKEEFAEFNEMEKLDKKSSSGNMSFAKKLIINFKDDSRPIKKIHRMVKRMLKRKIHPGVEERKSIDCAKLGSGSRGKKISGSISLLPTQLAITPGPTIRALKKSQFSKN